MNEKITALPMKTICVGRFLVDVPAEAIVTYRGAGVTGWAISTVADERSESFKTRLKEKESELRATKNERGGQSLELVHDVSRAGLIGRIYIFNRIWLNMGGMGPERIEESVSIDALIYMNNVSYAVKGEFHKPGDVRTLEALIAQLVPRQKEEIPKQAGFCFDRAMIVGEMGVRQHETVAMSAGLHSHPDLAIALTSLAAPRPSKTLLERDAENSIKFEYRSNFHELRKGPRSLNGIPGEEILEHVSELNGTSSQSFMWESLMSTTDVYLPSLSLEFDTGYGRPGKPVNSSMSDNEALALWDRISGSLRRRPATDQPPASQPVSSSKS